MTKYEVVITTQEEIKEIWQRNEEFIIMEKEYKILCLQYCLTQKKSHMKIKNQVNYIQDKIKCFGWKEYQKPHQKKETKFPQIYTPFEWKSRARRVVSDARTISE